ncbi:MAG: glycosyltransferase family 39 protein [Candidatus Krumholzibacteria bacterium]|nr:glycosyltransferase family 39 protein [Candidatus Krumholzibacteria bacterium]MDH4336371.1 glycosyltransferase family 39 protein [Candidatus Krumholzibacteria bacterium]MDH5269496.1 glycosyltransferase family 39 protein [Candidatus Krumholzibacteria bacterium]
MNPHRPDAAGITEWRARRALLAIVAIGAILRLFHIGYQSLWVDEMLTLEVATPKPGYPIWQLLLHNIHGPLHTFVVFLFRGVSESDAWLRLPSAIAGIVSIPLLFGWLRPRLGARTALWSALLLAINPLHIHYSQELRNYAFVVCFVLAGCVQIDRLTAGWSRGRAFGLSSLVAAAVLSNFSAVFAFAAQSIAFLRGAGRLRVWLPRWAAVGLMAAALLSPWIYRVTTYIDFGRLATPVMPGQLDPSERLRGETTFRFESIPYAVYAYSVGLSLGPSLRELHGDASLGSVVQRHAAVVLWVGLLFGAVTLAGLRAVRRAMGWGGLLEMAGYLLIPLVATLLLNWQNAKAFNVRYVLVGLPAYVAFLAAGVTSLRATRRLWVGGALAATSLLSLGNHYFNPRFAREDVKRAVAGVEARADGRECIFAPTVWPVVRHYLTTDAPLHFVYGGPPGVAQRQLDAMFAQCDTFWYLRARPWVDDPDGRVRDEIERRCEPLDHFSTAGVEATRYRVKQPLAPE